MLEILGGRYGQCDGISRRNFLRAGTLGLAVNNPPTQADVQTIADKIDELINALRR